MCGKDTDQIKRQKLNNEVLIEGNERSTELNFLCCPMKFGTFDPSFVRSFQFPEEDLSRCSKSKSKLQSEVSDKEGNDPFFDQQEL